MNPCQSIITQRWPLALCEQSEHDIHPDAWLMTPPMAAIATELELSVGEPADLPLPGDALAAISIHLTARCKPPRWGMVPKLDPCWPWRWPQLIHTDLNIYSVYGVSSPPGTRFPGHHPRASYLPANTLEHTAWLRNQRHLTFTDHTTLSSAQSSLPVNYGQLVEDIAVAREAILCSGVGSSQDVLSVPNLWKEPALFLPQTE